MRAGRGGGVGSNTIPWEVLAGLHRQPVVSCKLRPSRRREIRCGVCARVVDVDRWVGCQRVAVAAVAQRWHLCITKGEGCVWTHSSPLDDEHFGISEPTLETDPNDVAHLHHPPASLLEHHVNDVLVLHVHLIHIYGSERHTACRPA